MTSILLISAFVLVVVVVLAFRNSMQRRNRQRSAGQASLSPEWWRNEILR